MTGSKGIMLGSKGPKGDQGVKGDAGAQGLKGDTGSQGVKGDPGTAGANSTGLVGTVTLAESALLTLALGVRRLTATLAGTVVGGSYVASPVSAPPAGYSIQDAYCSTAGQITVGIIVPALGVATSYSIPVKVYRIN